MSLDPRMILSGAQQAIGTSQGVIPSLLGGVQSGQQMRQNLLLEQAKMQQMEQLRAQEARAAQLDALRRESMGQDIAAGKMQLDQAQKTAALTAVADAIAESELKPDSEKAAYIREKLKGVGGLAEELANSSDEEILEDIPKVKQMLQQRGLIGQQKALYQKAEGGMVFNPSTGTFTVDPVAAKRLDQLARIKAGKPLDTKDIQSINKDLTSLTKSAVEVKRAAEELEGLEKLKSPAAKLGAVFKFMKALDPTSVVRETEQGQVYAAEGAGAELAGMINSLLGKGKLSDEGFQDLVRTSKNIANSNISSTESEVTKWLDTFELDGELRVKLENRIPSKFEGTGKRIRFDANGNIIQ